MTDLGTLVQQLRAIEAKSTNSGYRSVCCDAADRLDALDRLMPRIEQAIQAYESSENALSAVSLMAAIHGTRYTGQQWDVSVLRDLLTLKGTP